MTVDLRDLCVDTYTTVKILNMAFPVANTCLSVCVQSTEPEAYGENSQGLCVSIETIR